MSWIKWTAGLILFDILLILMIFGFGADGTNIGTTALDINDPLFNSSSTIGVSDLGTLWDTFTTGFTNMPWWVTLFLVVYNGVLVTILTIALIRGVE